MSGPAFSPSSVWDPDAVLVALGGDEALLVAVTEKFLQDLPNLVAKLEAAMDKKDAQAMGRAAHTIKGVIAYFKAAPGLAAAQRIDVLGRSGDLEGASRAWPELARELARLESALREWRDGRG